MAVKPFRTGVPAGDHHVEIGAEDGIIRRGYDGGQTLFYLLDSFAFGDIRDDAGNPSYQS